MKTFLTFLFIIIPQLLIAQNTIVSGKIIDVQNKQPLAFVSIVIEGTRLGTVSDIDGKFRISAKSDGVFLISYVGYERKKIAVSEVRTIIELIPKANELGEVVIRPTANPAHRIIKLVVENKPTNDPENYEAFQYHSYTLAGLSGTSKNIKPADPEKLRKLQERNAEKIAKRKPRTPTQRKEDSTMARVGNELIKNYILVNETHTFREYTKPKSKETVLATKVSGLEKAPFAFVPSVFQPFGFYKELLQMADAKTYQSPLTKGAIRQYDFEFLDTLIHEKDSTFIISFAPQVGKNFEGLRGILYINSDKYAIENVIAEPATLNDRKMIFKLHQKYERVIGRWFPTQLNSEIVLTAIQKNPNLKSIDSTASKWTTRSYIYDINFNNPQSKFNDISQEMDDEARTKDNDYWHKARPDTLDTKAQKTYDAYEKMPERIKNKINQKVNGYSNILESGAIAIGKNLELPLKYIFSGANPYEEFRLSAGLRTSPQFSKFMTAEAFAGYGFGDKALKYGGSLQLNFNKLQTHFLKIGYAQDLEEPAFVNTVFKEYTPELLLNGSIRQFYASRFDSIQRFKMEWGVRPFRKTQLKLWYQTENRNPALYDYSFVSANGSQIHQFTNVEIGTTLRLASDENYNRSGRNIYATQLPKRLLIVHFSQGITNFDYQKLNLQYSQTINTIGLGKTVLRLEAAKIWGKAPYSYLFQGNGSSTGKSGQFYVPYSFQAMGLYEFLSDQYTTAFVSHYFGKLLFKTNFKYSQPELSLHHGYNIGSLNKLPHKYLTFNTLEKGYNESGLMIDNIFRFEYVGMMYLGLSVGGFYRYGAYALDDKTKNLAWRVGVNVSF